jgi:methanogen extracellular protein (TIGR04279 family)/PGF-pre-PGF domain-containing protein
MRSPGSGIQSADEGKGIQLPKPITIKYSGPRFEKSKDVSGIQVANNNRNYQTKYPLISSYATLPVYLPGESASMSYFGSSVLEGNVSIYVFNVTTKVADGILADLATGNVANLGHILNKSMNGNYKNYSAVLDKNGDISNYNLGSFDPGLYCIAIVQKNEDGSLIILSETAFLVSNYKLNASAPTSIDEEENLDISMSLEDAPSNTNFTYGAILVNEQVYKANIEINSNGTYNGTSVKVNGENFTDRFELNASNYKSKFTRNEVQEKVQELIGEGNGSIAIGEIGQKNLSLTTSDLSPGHYYLFIGAYSPQTKIAGLTQREIDIASLLPPNPPVANFVTNVTSGYAPLAVLFTDLSQNATSRNWDFNNDGTLDSNDGTPICLYTSPGIYTANLTVSNANGTASKTAIITVTPPPVPPTPEPPTPEPPVSEPSDPGNNKTTPVDDPTTHGSGGSSSGSMSSPESSKNIKSKEISEQFISNGKIIRFDFPKKATPIVYIEFKAKKSVGKTKTIVEELTGKSSLTPNEPTGEIYNHINIWVGNNGFANANSIENATVGFKVSKDWINGNHIKVDSVVLQHFANKKWEPLPTKKINEDTGYVYFEAKTSSFSPFAISAEKLVTEENGETGQLPSKVTPEEEITVNTSNGTAPQENNDSGISKVASFSIGFVVVLLIGAAFILKNKKPEQ